jgi:hypothetical protein
MKVGPRPSKKDWNEQFPEWLSQFEGAVDSAVTMNNVKFCFSNSGIYPINSTVVTHSLPTTYPSELTPQRQSRMLDIGNKVVSSAEFLQLWTIDEEKKIREKRNKRRVDIIEKKRKKRAILKMKMLKKMVCYLLNYLYICYD